MKSIKVTCSGYALCKSSFYSAIDMFHDHEYLFSPGVNVLLGEIDSGNWAVSYFLSMYCGEKKRFQIHCEKVQIDGDTISSTVLSKSSCYMDVSYPMFSTKKTVRQLIKQGLKRNSIGLDCCSIMTLFSLDSNRIDRPVSALGTHKYRAMAAIAYAHGKQIYCYPWISESRYQVFKEQLLEVNRILSEQDMIVILPKGCSNISY